MAKVSARRKSVLDKPEEVLNLAQLGLEWAKGQWQWVALGLTLIVVVVAAWFIHAQVRQHREAAATAALAKVRPQLATPQAATAAALDQVVKDYSGTNAARDAQLLRANLLYQQKNYAAAAQAYESLLPSGDPAWDALINESLSYCYADLGDYKKAASVLKSVEEQSSGPLKGEVLQRLALLLEKSGNYQEATVYWKKLLDQGNNPAMMPYVKEKLAAAAAARGKK